MVVELVVMLELELGNVVELLEVGELIFLFKLLLLNELCKLLEIYVLGEWIELLLDELILLIPVVVGVVIVLVVIPVLFVILSMFILIKCIILLSFSFELFVVGEQNGFVVDENIGGNDEFGDIFKNGLLLYFSVSSNFKLFVARSILSTFGDDFNSVLNIFNDGTLIFSTIPPRCSEKCVTVTLSDKPLLSNEFGCDSVGVKLSNCCVGKLLFMPIGEDRNLDFCMLGVVIVGVGFVSDNGVDIPVKFNVNLSPP